MYRAEIFHSSADRVRCGILFYLFILSAFVSECFILLSFIVVVSRVFICNINQ